MERRMAQATVMAEQRTNLVPMLQRSTENPGRRTTTDEEDRINERIQRILHPGDAHEDAQPDMAIQPTSASV